MIDRLKEIKKKKYELTKAIKEFKKELVNLTNEEKSIIGYQRVIKGKQKYRRKGKRR